MPQVYNNITLSFHSTALIFGADPRVFSILYALSVPIFWFFFLRAFYRWQRQLPFQVSSLCALAATIAPYAYLDVTGRHVPGWIGGVLISAAALGSLALYVATRRCRERWTQNTAQHITPEAAALCGDAIAHTAVQGAPA